MGRQSKLTDAQWDEVKQRVLNGESRRAVAREYGISESALREKISAQISEVKDVANQIVATDRALRALPISAQVSAINLAQKLTSISNHMVCAAEFGAATANHLLSIAHRHAAKVDEANPTSKKSTTALNGVLALTKAANDASEIGMNLLRANKEAVADLTRKVPPPPVTAEDLAKLTDEELGVFANLYARLKG
jgi:hypothetical protein